MFSIAKTMGPFAIVRYHFQEIRNQQRAKGQNMKLRHNASTFHTLSALAAYAMVSLLLAGPAAAQQTTMDATTGDIFGLFGTQFGDAFTSVFLNQIFGPLFPSPTAQSGATVFSFLIGYFNTIVLVVAGLLFFWNVTVGVLTTANEGKVLGQRYSTLWAAPRVVFAIGMMVPVAGLGGYNVAQAGVGYIVRAGTNIGSELWKNGASMVINGEIPIATEAIALPPSTITKMYEMAACMVIVGEQIEKAGGGLRPTLGPLSDNPNRLSTYLDDGSGVPVLNGDLCGEITLPELPRYIQNTSDETMVTTLPQAQSVRGRVEDLFVSMHRDAAIGAFRSLLEVAQANQPAARDASVRMANFEQQIRDVVAESGQRLQSGTNEIVDVVLDSGGGAGGGRVAADARNALLTRINGSNCTQGAAEGQAIHECMGEGWMGAGSWYMVLAKLNNELTSLTTASSSATSGTYIEKADARNRQIYSEVNGSSWWQSSRRGAERAGMASHEQATEQMARHIQGLREATMGLAALGFEMSMDDLAEIGEVTDNSWLLQKLGVRAWTMSMMESIIGLGSPTGPFGDSDPMVGITNLGNEMVEMAGYLMAAIIGVGFTPFGGPGIATMFTPLVGILMLAGGTLAFILPMTPFLFWILAVTGYFLVVVEAVIAVNLWALAHMRLEGEGISGEAGKQGWLMLLSLFMTPSLMIFGFFVGMQIFRVTTSLIDMMFAQAFAGIYNGGVFTGFILVLVYAVVIAVMYMVLIERSFSLVTEFPGKVMRWIGASAEITNGEENRARMAMAAGAGSMWKGTQMATQHGNKMALDSGFNEKGGGAGADGRPRGGAAYRWRESRTGSAKGGGGNDEKSSGPRPSG